MLKRIKCLFVFLCIICFALMLNSCNNKLNYFYLFIDTKLVKEIFNVERYNCTINIKPRNQKDLEVDGKIVFNQITISYLDYNGTRKKFRNSDKFEIALDKSGFASQKLKDIRGLNGFSAFTKSSKNVVLDFDHILPHPYREFRIEKIDAHFEGTVKEND